MPQRDPSAARRALNERVATAIRRALGRRPPLPLDATADVRLRHLEADVAEVRSRVNALFVAALSSLALELLGRVTQ